MELVQEFQLKYSELDCNLNLKTSNLLNFLQDIASDSAQELGFGYSFVRKHNLAWYLLKYHIEFYEQPKNAELIRISTQPRGYMKFFAFRDFEIVQNSKTIAKAVSTWTMVDMSTKEPKIIKDYIDTDKMPPYLKKEGDLSYVKIPLLENITFRKTFDIRFGDIDVNKHVNNSNYLIWALEALDFDFRIEHTIKTLDIVYKKEISYGNSVVSEVEIKDKTTNHVIKNAKTDEVLANIYITWN